MSGSDRKEYLAEYYRKNKERIKEQRKAVRASRHKERLATDPEYQKKHAEYNEKRRISRKERMVNDPEYARHVREQQMRRHRERMATDPEYRRKHEENELRQNERRKQFGR